MDRDSDVVSSPPSDPHSTVHENARKCTIGADLDSPTGSLSPQQSRAISMLLNGVALAQVAQKVGVNPSTLYRWRHDDPDFIRELTRRRESLWDECVDQMRALLRPAISVLTEQVAAKYEPTSFRAASAILRLANMQSAIPVVKERS